MKLLPLHAVLCLAFLAGQLPQVSKAEAAENSGNTLRKTTQQIADPRIRKLSTAHKSRIRSGDLISRADLRRGVRFTVPGHGEFELLDMRSAVNGRDCKGHLPSLIKAIAQNPPTGDGPQWLNLTIYDGGPDLGTICLAPLGGSCYKMIRKATP